jgi:hypothetical protein
VTLERIIWREIFGRTAKRVRLVNDNLGETKIDEHAITPVVNENILRLQITVANNPMVKVC